MKRIDSSHCHEKLEICDLAENKMLIRNELKNLILLESKVLQNYQLKKI